MYSVKHLIDFWNIILTKSTPVGVGFAVFMAKKLMLGQGAAQNFHEGSEKKIFRQVSRPNELQ